MRLCRFTANGNEAIGFTFGDGRVAGFDAAASAAGIDAPAAADLRDLVTAGPDAWAQAQAVVDATGLLDATGDWSSAADDVTFHHPYRPRQNILRAGWNSRLAAGEAKLEPLPKLRYYTMSPTSVVDPGEPISWPIDLTEQVYAEPQLAVVVGKPISFLSPSEALECVFGYAVATDVNAYDLMLLHGQWDKPTSMDSFFPWGPTIVTADEAGNVDNLAASLQLNSETVIEGSTSDAILSVGEVLSELGTGTTIEAGDVVVFGAPEALGFGQSPERWLREGDVVESSIEGLGSITNPVSPYKRG